MNKGFLIYAPDSKQKDVVDSVILSALSIKITQKKYNNVALLTDNKTNFPSQYFDKITVLNLNGWSGRRSRGTDSSRKALSDSVEVQKLISNPCCQQCPTHHRW